MAERLSSEVERLDPKPLQDVRPPSGGPVFPNQFCHAVCRGGCASQHGLVVQVTPHVCRKAIGRFVPASSILLQALHHDPVQIAT